MDYAPEDDVVPLIFITTISKALLMKFLIADAQFQYAEFFMNYLKELSQKQNNGLEYRATNIISIYFTKKILYKYKDKNINANSK
jgi:hypothetical protein